MTTTGKYVFMLTLCLASSLCKAKVVDMTGFGLSASNPEMAESKIARAFDYCISGQRKPEEKIIIRFEKGVYKISSADILFKMDGCHDIEIDGGGSTFLFSKKAGFASILGSRNITLRNFSLDWDRPYITQAEIAGMTDEYIDLKIDREKYPWLIKGKRLRFVCGGKEYGAAEHGYNIVYSKDGNIFSGSFDNYALTDVINGPAEELAGGIVRCHGKISKTFPRGNMLAIWHVTYKTPWCTSTDSENVLLKDITIRHTVGCGVVSTCTRNMTVDNVDYIPAEGRFFTGIADAFHIVHNSGKFIMQNCDINGQGDDALNVHGRYLKITSRNDGRNKFRYIVQAGHPLLHPGDSVWGICKENMQRIPLGKVVRLRKTGIGIIPRGERKIFGEIYEITLESGIRVPKNVSFFENATCNPEVIIRNNTFGRANRARGILLTSPCKTVVEKNVFRSSGAAILIEGDTDFWLESGGTNGLVIKDNIFDKCHSSPWGAGVIAFSPSHKPESENSVMYHKNISITGNRFIMESPELLFLRSVENLTFENNQIDGSAPIIIQESHKGTIIKLSCDSQSSTCNCNGNETDIITDEAGITDYSPIVREILSKYPEGNVTLKFGRGIYEFYPEKASEEFLNISNNDSGNKKIAFLIKDMENVRIEGDGSDFLFHGSIVPAAILRSKNVIFKGISIDYDYAWTFEGKVIDNDESSRSFTVKVLPENKYRVSDGHLMFSGYDWEFPMNECFIFDPTTRRPIYDTFAYFHGYWAGDMTAEDLGDGLVRFSGHNGRALPPVGSIWNDKGPTGENRKYPGIAILRSEDVLIENVRVYRSGAMSLISEYSKDVTVRGFSTERHENSERMVTSSADATHFVNCKGKIILEDCKFESMLDDATNVHGIYMLTDSILSPTRICARFGHFQQEGNWFAEEGDTLRFIDQRTMRPVGKGKLRSIDRSSRKQYIIETDFEISDTTIAYAIENISCAASVEIRNCTVQYNRARSFLISTAGDVLIENCTLKPMMAGINISGDANFWYESGGTRNITIRNNYFENIAIGGNEPQCVLQIDPMVKKDTRQNDFHYHGNVIFEGNKIATFDNQVIYARCLKSLKIKDNTFIRTDNFKAFYPSLAVIDIQFCKDLEISGNDFSWWNPKAKISLHECQNIINDTGFEVTDKPNGFFERF